MEPRKVPPIFSPESLSHHATLKDASPIHRGASGPLDGWRRMQHSASRDPVRPGPGEWLSRLQGLPWASSQSSDKHPKPGWPACVPSPSRAQH